MIELWKPIVGFEDYYEVSDRGRVRNLRRGNMLKARCGSRYPHVELRGVERTVHSLVLEAFIGPRPHGMEALHWDDDKRNNTLSNLRWGTVYENQADALRNGVPRRGPSPLEIHAPRVKDLFAAGLGPRTIEKYLNLYRGAARRLENCHRYG